MQQELELILTPREKRVARLLMQGCHQTEIARELKMPLRTVKKDFDSMYRKFGIGIEDRSLKYIKLAVQLSQIVPPGQQDQQQQRAARDGCQVG